MKSWYREYFRTVKSDYFFQEPDTLVAIFLLEALLARGQSGDRVHFRFAATIEPDRDAWKWHRRLLRITASRIISIAKK